MKVLNEYYCDCCQEKIKQMKEYCILDLTTKTSYVHERCLEEYYNWIINIIDKTRCFPMVRGKEGECVNGK